MKKRTLSLLLLSLFSLTAFCSDVVTGKLDNGLTYYLCNDSSKKGTADFYIIQKVGALQEEKGQEGLAHLLEHMAFNGTKHFKSGEILKFIQSKGLSFGADMNAMTMQDRTLYFIKDMKVGNEQVVDSCLLILHDWSHDITLDNTEIAKERKVVHEEWRSRTMNTSVIEATHRLFGDSRWSRPVIGDMQVVDHCNSTKLQKFYDRWYRPKRQAVLIVGDIDTEQMEQKVKTFFADIPKSFNDDFMQEFDIPDNDEPFVVTAQNQFQREMHVTLNYKTPRITKAFRSTDDFQIYKVRLQIIQRILRNRWNALRGKADYKSNPIELKDKYIAADVRFSITSTISCNAKNWRHEVKRVITELERLRRFGITEAEDTVDVRPYLESHPRELVHQNRSKLTDACVSNFIANEPMPLEDWSDDMKERIRQATTKDSLETFFRQLYDGRNLTVLMIAADNLPAEDSIKAVIAEVVGDQTIQDYNLAQEGLPKTEIKSDPDSIYKAQFDEKVKVERERDYSHLLVKREKGAFDSDVLTLANGVTVIVKQTDYEKGYIELHGRKFGGLSTFDDADLLDAQYINKFPGLWGTNINVNEYDETVYFKCATSYLPYKLEYLRQAVEEPKDSREYFEEKLRKETEKSFLAYNNFASVLTRELSRAILKTDRRIKWLTMENIDSLNYNHAKELHRERLANWNGAKFYIVGDVNTDSILRPILQNLATLPAKAEPDTIVFRDYNYYHDSDIHTVKHTDTNGAQIAISYQLFCQTKGYKYGRDTHFVQEAFRQLAAEQILKAVREEMGATYTPQVSGSDGYLPKNMVQLSVILITSPENREKATRCVRNELERIANGTTSLEAGLTDYKEKLKRGYESWSKQNHYMHVRLQYVYELGYDLDEDMIARVESITPEQVRTFARQFLDNAHTYEVTILPNDKK